MDKEPDNSLFRNDASGMARVLIGLFLASFQLAGVGLAKEKKTKDRVMSWVPPYAIEECRKNLDESFGGVGVKNGLTHLGLQFWVPTEEGGIKFVDRFKKIDDTMVALALD